MCLYDQPAEQVSEEALLLLPVCCGFLEEALFRLHSDEDAGAPSRASAHTTAWLDTLDDEQLMGAQRAFHAAVRAALDFVEAVRAECGSVSGGAVPLHDKYPLLLPICRLLAAWLVQPSSAAALQLYDRAVGVLPLLRAASSAEKSAWAKQLCAFEPEVAAISSPEKPTPTDPPAAAAETMAELFTRMMRAEGQPPEELQKLMQQLSSGQ